jgi:hypothetical protein
METSRPRRTSLGLFATPYSSKQQRVQDEQDTKAVEFLLLIGRGLLPQPAASPQESTVRIGDEVSVRSIHSVNSSHSSSSKSSIALSTGEPELPSSSTDSDSSDSSALDASSSSSSGYSSTSSKKKKKKKRKSLSSDQEELSRSMLEDQSKAAITVLKYLDEQDKKQKSKWFPKLRQRKKRLLATSYGDLLKNPTTLDNADGESCEDMLKARVHSFNLSEYDPYYLDDPNVHDTSEPKGLPTIMSLLFNKDSEAKKEQNVTFASSHPEQAERNLSLSKIRALKRHILDIVQEMDLELSTAAISYVLLEKLMIKGLVSKENRKSFAAACLLLTVKVNEPKERKIGPILSCAAEEFRISSTEILQREFPIYAALEFSLFPSRHEYIPHLKRILKAKEIPVEGYIKSTCRRW